LILLVAFIAVFLEATFDGIRHLLGAQIDLLPALMVYASLSAGLPTIVLLAACGGLWFDTLSANPLGVTIAPLFAIGYLIYLQRELILREQGFAQMTLGLIASAVLPVLVLLLLSLLSHPPVLSWVSVWQWLVMSLGGALLTPLCFRLFDSLSHALFYRPAFENTFRMDREIKRGRK
jgi:rod shape-determining protein MreD